VREAFRTWIGAFADYRQEREVIGTVDDCVLLRVYEYGRGKGSGAEVMRTTYGLWTIHQSRAVRIAFYESSDQALEAAGLSE
jgi:hypothetical protein